ncbi:PstS family phosphate ABC transporter substrate-binding protein [Phaeobacter sp. B1627]|uniref:PstS family phosphate ABC transporter substrate-binding protein n=1 Tax=Phaeobacter sp. B1627 TaxID=2583809 RepID=UPI00111BC149|nr:substrate-binding domain-containing protein [Phaeobacter sp. B1627]TNJ39341.1 hypothetical protein FGE21_19030 [Phaeobacter sp. B1627]
MSSSVLRSATIALGAMATAVFCDRAEAETLRIGGTGVALGSIAVLVDAFEAQHPGSKIEVLPSLGSGGGIKAVIAQAIDLGLSSRPLKDKEIQGGATARSYAQTSMVFATSAGNEASIITPQDIVEIYSGVANQWPDGSPIRLVMRPPSEGDIQIIRGLSPEIDMAVDVAFERSESFVAMTDQENAETLERLEGSFGLMAIGQIKAEGRQLKALTLVTPQAEGATSGPDDAFLKTLYLVSSEAASPLAVEFQNFIFSDEAQTILSSYEFNPVN